MTARAGKTALAMIHGKKGGDADAETNHDREFV